LSIHLHRFQVIEMMFMFRLTLFTIVRLLCLAVLCLRMFFSISE